LAFRYDVIKLLLKQEVKINEQDNNGCTALMRAAYSGYAEMVQYLLDHGADKELVDAEGNKAIHYVRTDCLTELKPLLK
jgi:ankyrin repeat protein